MAGKPLSLLLLCDYRADIAATVRDHIDAIARWSRHHVHVVSILGELPANLPLERFDAVVVHYTLVACLDSYVSPETRAALSRFRGLKALFIQDEYRFVDASIAAMREIGIHVLFTCVPVSEIDKVYSEVKLPGVRKINVLTGYVPEKLTERTVLPISARPIDVGYRGRKVPYWLGALGQEKYEIGRRFGEEVVDKGFKIDIGFREEDRLYSEAWINFVANCKAMLGVESGASVFDFTGEIQRKVEAHLIGDPNADFKTLSQLYFADMEGSIRLNQISPRCFEMAALRTLMILYEGEYSGLLKPWRHYVPLRKDHSNLDAIFAVLQDSARAQAIVDAAYREVALNPANTFRAFVDKFDASMEAAFRPEMAATGPAITPRELSRLSSPTFTTLRRRASRKGLHLAHKFIFGVLLGRTSGETRARIHARLYQVFASVCWLVRRQ